MEENRGDYIESIDGLRAVAVLCVLLFHLDISWFRGGYIGVDAFFVISGFVITRKIAREVSERQFNLADFYFWRIARLVPALLAVVLLTLLAGYFLLGPDDLARLGRVSIWTVLPASNVVFWLESGYFDADAAYKPLLHTWSLGVEEQFYFVWPLLILFALHRFGRHGALVTAAGAGLASLGAALAFNAEHADAVFFLTPFRVFQFVIGALLALGGIGRGSGMLTSGLTGVALLAIILISATAGHGDVPYLYAAVAPALATGAAIWSANSRLANLALASGPLVWVGRRSYSIYLVHWPLVVFWKMATDYTLSPVEAAVALPILIGGGALLHWAVERRFRFRKGQSRRFRSSVLAGVGATGAAAILAGTLFWAHKGYPERVPAELRSIAEDTRKGWAARKILLRSGTCNFQINTFKASEYDAAACSSPPGDRKSYLIIGDSIASDTYLIFTRAFPELYFGQLTIPGCRLQLPARFDGDSPCRQLFALGLGKLAFKGGYDGVILASNWIGGRYDLIDDLVKHFAGKGLEIVLTGQRVQFADRLPAIFSSALSKEAAAQRAQHLVQTHPFKINEDLKTRFAKRTTFVDFIGLQCPSACTVVDAQGRLLYLDHLHISLAGADLLAERLREAYAGLLATKDAKR